MSFINFNLFCNLVNRIRILGDLREWSLKRRLNFRYWRYSFYVHLYLTEGNGNNNTCFWLLFFFYRSAAKVTTSITANAEMVFDSKTLRDPWIIRVKNEETCWGLLKRNPQWRFLKFVVSREGNLSSQVLYDHFDSKFLSSICVRCHKTTRS